MRRRRRHGLTLDEAADIIRGRHADPTPLELELVAKLVEGSDVITGDQVLAKLSALSEGLLCPELQTQRRLLSKLAERLVPGWPG